MTSYVQRVLRRPGSILGCMLPLPLAGGAVAGWPRLLPGILGFPSQVRVYIEENSGEPQAAALVYEGRRPEWAVLLLTADPDPAGADAAFRLLAQVVASAARRGMHRLYGSVPDETRPRETYFQAGFYSYTRETWYVAPPSPATPVAKDETVRQVRQVDAHDLFRLYAATTPHAVQRAEQLSVQDFDVRRGAGAFEPPHLISGNPLAMRRRTAYVRRAQDRAVALAVGFRGLERHPHVLKVRTAEGDVDAARDMARRVSADLGSDRPLAAPVRSYEEHVARALLAEGFKESATAMLFVKELAVRIEEPALAPMVVR